MVHLLDAMPGLLPFVQKGRLDILAGNPLGQALYADLDAPRGATGDLVTPIGARFAFLDERAGQSYPDRDKAAADTVAAPRL